MSKATFRRSFLKASIQRCLRQIVLGSILYIGFLFLLFFFGYSVIRWRPGPFYEIANWIRNFMSILAPLGWIVVALGIVFASWRQLAGYIDEIAEAAKQLIEPDDHLIELSDALREVEDQLNTIKQVARRNERTAKDAEARKNDMVVNLAHDIRTPLSSVIGYLTLLDEASDMPEAQRRKYTAVALEKAHRLERLVEEFFEITRFNLTTLVLNKRTIALPMMLEQLAEEFYPLLDAKGQRAEIEVVEHMTVSADPDKLSRVFNNILKNAVHYSYRDTVIKIEAFEVAETGVCIRFVSHGDPIPAHQLETIFERFFRLDAARSTETGGSGLGLSIAREIVTAHGGTLTAESDVENTVFSVVLPSIPLSFTKA